MIKKTKIHLESFHKVNFKNKYFLKKNISKLKIIQNYMIKYMKKYFII